MPTTLKCLISFKADEGYGWTETHYRLSSSDTPNLKLQLDALEGAVIPTRAAILGQNCSIVGYRVSYPRTGAIASQSRRRFWPGEATQKAGNQDSSLAVVFTDTTNTRHKVVHVRGFWDVVEFNQTYHPEEGDPFGWTDRLVAWKNALVAGAYGWKSKDPATSAAGIVTTYTQNINGQVTFTLAAPGMPLATVGTIQQVRFSKINNSQSPLNQPLLVNVISQVSLQTVQAIGCGPFVSPGRFNFRATSFVGYNDTESISLGERRMGQPLFRYPGRSKARRRY